MKLLFLDTETTGVEDKDRLCQVAYRCEGETDVNEYFKPPLQISIMAMSICHITNEMVDAHEAFSGSETAIKLQKLLDDGAVLVAHNAKFDIKMLAKEGITVPKHICTLKIARHLDTDGVIPSYKLQYLRYMLGLKIEADAHDAFGDILVLEAVFNRMLSKIIDGEVEEMDDGAIEGMVEISSKPSMINRFTFGKHVGKTLMEVSASPSDKGYLKWLLGEKLKNEPDDEDWIYTLNYYVHGKT